MYVYLGWKLFVFRDRRAYAGPGAAPVSNIIAFDSESRAGIRHEADGFWIWAGIWYYLSVDWKAYQALEGARCPIDGVEATYSPRTGTFTPVDITLRKLLWSRKLAADIAVRTLFDDRVSFHSIGATFGLSFFFQLSFALPAM